MIRKLVGKLFWGSIWVVAIFSSFYVYYFKYPDVRAKVDAKLPIAKEIHATIISGLHLDDTAVQAPAPTPVPQNVVQTPPVAAPTPQVAAVPSTSPVSPVAELVPQSTPDTVDVTQLTQSKAEWPKLVALKKVVDFPAVMDGKVVGNVQAPAGAQVQLILIKDGKAGVEFQGGGAMVDVGDTDLIERVQASRHASVK